MSQLGQSMGFLFDLPLILSGPVLIAMLVGLSILGVNWFRKHRHPLVRWGDGDVEFIAAMLTSIMVFYGLATALTTVQVWETYVDVKEITEHEAAALATLYRNVSEYPEPVRSVLQGELRSYTHQVINESWPLQRQGRIPLEGIKAMDLLQSTLLRFEPRSEAEKVLAREALESFNRMMDARRMRLGSVDRQLPGVLWLVVVLGALISLVSSFYFRVHDAGLHRAQVGLLAGFIGLVIFIILALDRPYRGDLGLRATPYELVYEHLMSSAPQPTRPASP